jgi:hypothetical protein
MQERIGPTLSPAEIPAGLESLLTLAAVNDDFAAVLARDPEGAVRASGVALTPAERAILAASTPESLRQLAAAVRERLPRPARRRFLALATAAVMTLVAGGAVTRNRSSCAGSVALASEGRAVLASPSPTPGNRPDRPVRPRPGPRENAPTAGIQPDRPEPPRPMPKPSSRGSGCNR